MLAIQDNLIDIYHISWICNVPATHILFITVYSITDSLITLVKQCEYSEQGKYVLYTCTADVTLVSSNSQILLDI